MVTTHDEIREQQRATWNKFSGGWKKQDAFVTEWLDPMGEKLLDLAHIKEGFQVLDVATGTGEPGLTAARRIGHGRVVGIDIAGEMLKVAEGKAQAAGIANYETRVANETAMPFPDNAFHAVLCRLGIMYFPDTASAVGEFVRVAQPAGALALSAWAEPPKNPWATIAAGIVNHVLELPPPPQGAPGIFRCAEPGALAALLRTAGLRDVRELEVRGTVVFGSPEAYWEFITDVVAPVATALSKASPDTQESIRRAVIEAVQAQYGRGQARMEWSSWVAAGVK